MEQTGGRSRWKRTDIIAHAIIATSGQTSATEVALNILRGGRKEAKRAVCAFSRDIRQITYQEVVYMKRIVGEDRERLIQMYLDGVSSRKIYAILPYTVEEIKAEIVELSKEGVIPRRRDRYFHLMAITRAYNDGITDVQELMEYFGYSRNTILTYLVASADNVERLQKQRTKAIIARIKEGGTLAAIGREFGVTRQAIYEIKRRYMDGNS